MRSPSATSSGPTVKMMMRCDSPTCDMLAPFTGALGAATRCHSEERRLSFAKATSMWLPVRRIARLDPQRAQPYCVTALVGAESFESIEACGWRPPARRRGDRRECRMLREAEAVPAQVGALGSGRIRSCAAAPIGLDPGERFVANAVVPRAPTG